MTTASYNLSQLGAQYVVNAWTPGITFGGASTGITYTTQTGNWTRNANIVLIEAVIQLTSKGSATGAMQITGLPITFPTSTGDFAVASTRIQNMTGLSGGTFASGSNGTSNMDVYQYTSTGFTFVTDTNVTNTMTVYFTLTCIA